MHGAPPGEEAAGRTDEDVGRSNELEAEQLGTYGEDQIADSVKGTQAGAAGKEADMASDLDRKKAEQAPARKAVQEEQSKSFDVGGLLAQRGGPASTVRFHDSYHLERFADSVSHRSIESISPVAIDEAPAGTVHRGPPAYTHSSKGIGFPKAS